MLYLMREPDYALQTAIHVGQIAEYLKFNEQVRARFSLSGLQSMPLGYTDFAIAWNHGTRANDPQCLSTVFLAKNPEHNVVQPLTHPAFIPDFYITPEQARLVADVPATMTTDLQSEITQEFATIMLERRRSQHRGYEERKEKRLQTFSAGPASQPVTKLSRANFWKKSQHHCHSETTYSPTPSNLTDSGSNSSNTPTSIAPMETTA